MGAAAVLVHFWAFQDSDDFTDLELPQDLAPSGAEGTPLPDLAAALQVLMFWLSVIAMAVLQM